MIKTMVATWNDLSTEVIILRVKKNFSIAVNIKKKIVKGELTGYFFILRIFMKLQIMLREYKCASP